MRLTNPTRTTSFYESFSDLIFGTLIIFLVVVLVLMLRVRGRQQELDRTIDSEIALNQYAGGARDTSWCFALVLDGDTPRVAFIPRDVWQAWDLSRSEAQNPIRTLSQHLAGPRPELALLTIEQFQATDDAFSLEFVRGGLVMTEIGDVVTQMLAARAGGERSAARLYGLVGGMHAGTLGTADRMAEPIRRASQRYFAFLAGPGPALPADDERRFFRHYETLRRPLDRAVETTRDQPARIRFSTDGAAGIRLGRSTLSGAEFGSILQSISVGRGFYIEYDGGTPEPTTPPEWVINDVLIPIGFDRRIPSEAALDLLRRRRRGRVVPPVDRRRRRSTRVHGGAP